MRDDEFQRGLQEPNKTSLGNLDDTANTGNGVPFDRGFSPQRNFDRVRGMIERNRNIPVDSSLDPKNLQNRDGSFRFFGQELQQLIDSGFIPGIGEFIAPGRAPSI